MGIPVTTEGSLVVYGRLQSSRKALLLSLSLVLPLTVAYSMLKPVALAASEAYSFPLETSVLPDSRKLVPFIDHASFEFLALAITCKCLRQAFLFASAVLSASSLLSSWNSGRAEAVKLRFNRFLCL